MTDKIYNIKTIIHDINNLIILKHEIEYYIDQCEPHKRAIESIDFILSTDILIGSYSELNTLYFKSDFDFDDLNIVIELINALTNKLNLEIDSFGITL